MQGTAESSTEKTASLSILSPAVLVSAQPNSSRFQVRHPPYWSVHNPTVLAFKFVTRRIGQCTTQQSSLSNSSPALTYLAKNGPQSSLSVRSPALTYLAKNGPLSSLSVRSPALTYLAKNGPQFSLSVRSSALTYLAKNGPCMCRF